MSQFGALYAQYYDLLYKDKDYNAEIEYISQLLGHDYHSASLLDLGCGTGKHAELLCNKGFNVHGVDKSYEMLKIANKRRVGRESSLEFIHSNIQDLNLNKKFDVVTSLFHVMSYQNSAKELDKAFEVVKKHLINGGFFIFDFWYGPAVLTDLPKTRVKHLEDEKLKITRVAEPLLHPRENVVDVSYDIFIQDKHSGVIKNKKELHKMRYFFDTELELICKSFGLTVHKKCEWLSTKIPDFDSWNVVWLLKN